MKGNLYEESDLVKIQDASGKVQEESVPKAWVGTDLLPDGSKQASQKTVDKTEGEEKDEADAAAKAKEEADAAAKAKAAATKK